jgi:hypothetical protein
MIMHNVLPFVCTVAGFCMVCNFNSPLSFYLGITFMLVACLVLMKRLNDIR